MPRPMPRPALPATCSRSPIISPAPSRRFPAELREDERLKAMVTGIEMTGKELDNVFQRNGITKIEAMGARLDPNKHQAMVELPHAEAEPGTVIQEMQAGYMIKDRLLRPALVGVSKAADARTIIPLYGRERKEGGLFLFFPLRQQFALLAFQPRLRLLAAELRGIAALEP